MAMKLCILFCFGLFTSYVSSLGDRSIQYIGPSIVSEGDSFTLTCVTPFQNASTWVLNGTIVITEENLLGFELMERKLYSYYREMLLSTVSAQLYQTGEYRCNGNSRDFHYLRVLEDADDIEEEVTESPAVKQKRDDGEKYPKRYYFEPNTNYAFICDAEDPKHPVVWYKETKRIDAFTAPNMELYDNKLFIHNAQLEDVGEYFCRLDTLFEPGKLDIVSRYMLTSPTQIVEISEKQNVVRGRSMTIHCKAKGYPAPKITWYIGNMNAYMLKEKDLRISVYSKRERYPNAYLTVRNMTNFDRGLYTCRAENGIALGSDKKYQERSIPVYVRDNIIEPNEDEPGLGKVLTPGETLTLECKIEECPYCSLVWFKEGEKLVNENGVLHVSDVNNSLTIHYPTLNDTGIYECAVDRDMLDVDIRASIKVQTCDALLAEGLAIKSVCEMPAETRALSSQNPSELSSFLLLIVILQTAYFSYIRLWF